MVKLILPWPPSANRYWRNYRGITVTSSDALAYKREAKYEARRQGAELLEGDVSVTANFYRPRRQGDLDNRIKVLFDAMIGVCYEDDDQVKHIEANLYDDPKHPRVEVEVLAI